MDQLPLNPNDFRISDLVDCFPVRFLELFHFLTHMRIYVTVIYPQIYHSFFLHIEISSRPDVLFRNILFVD